MEEKYTPTQTSGSDLEIIEFYLDEELADGSLYRSYYGMNVVKVLEIIRLPPITGVPSKHHPAALGTFNLRGRVLPLVDLGMWLHKKTTGKATQKVIVSEFSSVVTAFIVSGVTRIHRMSWGQVEPPGKYLQAFSHDCITGVVRFDERIVFLLDMEQVIGSMDPRLGPAHFVKDVAASGGEGYHVLVADDSPSVRNIITACLEQSKFTVSKATCGREAWEQLQIWTTRCKLENVPITNFVDLVISDIEMPEMDGHTLTRMIKGHDELKKLPVILFSSLISSVVREKGVQAGADYQIAKPDLPVLTIKARELIDRFRANEVS